MHFFIGPLNLYIITLIHLLIVTQHLFAMETMKCCLDKTLIGSTFVLASYDMMLAM